MKSRVLDDTDNVVDDFVCWIGREGCIMEYTTQAATIIIMGIAIFSALLRPCFFSNDFFDDITFISLT